MERQPHSSSTARSLLLRSGSDMRYSPQPRPRFSSARVAGYSSSGFSTWPRGQAGGPCTVRLQREAKLNALSEQMAAQLIAALGSDDVTGSRVVVLAGSAKAFSAGADLTEFTDPSPEGTIRYYRGPGRIWELLPELPQPSIAAISGWAIGGGLELALSADLRVADETARFGLPEVSLGILPSAGGMSRLVRLPGPARAKELILRGDRSDAHRAPSL